MSSTDPRRFADDELNPYAPPRSDVMPELLPGEIAPIPFTIGEVLSRTWQIYRDRMGSCIGVVVGCMGINIAAQLILSAVQVAVQAAGNQQAVTAVVTLVGMLALVLFQIWINIGQTIVLLRIARGEQAPFGYVFTGGRYLFRVIASSFLLGLIMLGVIALGTVPGGVVLAVVGRDAAAGQVAMALSMFVSVIIAIIVALRMSQFHYLIIDRDAGVLDSFRLSSQVTRDKAGVVFVIFLLTAAINLGGFLACFVGLFFTLPFTLLLLVVTYLALTGQATADPYSKGKPMADLESL
jgi:hypothetical protein